MAAVDRRRLVVAVGAVLVCYLALGVLFVVRTPRWQAPDEPAHFNYVRHVATTGRPPVLQEGCWDQTYLEQLKAEHFPPTMPIDPLCYEAHQPPVYYYLAAMPYHAADIFDFDPLYSVRLFTLFLGAAVVVVSAGIVRELYPGSVLLPSATAGIVATVPMHVAMLASVNNDALAELVLSLGVLQMLRLLRRPEGRRRRWLLLGITLGVGFITKTTVYLAVPLLFLTIWWSRRRLAPADWIRAAGIAVVPAVAMALPWFIRNSWTYGGLDILGLQRHERVVVGQPRTAEWLAELGVAGVLKRFVNTTFHSFWGQFGWMAAPLPDTFYSPLAVLVAVALAGVVLYTLSGGYEAIAVPHGMQLLGAWVLVTILAYGWYNLTFVQHQGRYLFPSLSAIAFFLTLGLREWIVPRYRPLALGAVIIGLLGIGVWSVVFILPGLA